MVPGRRIRMLTRALGSSHGRRLRRRTILTVGSWLPHGLHGSAKPSPRKSLVGFEFQYRDLGPWRARIQAAVVAGVHGS
ncbi:hypothetical protein Dimus_036430, partial [Dionaea muscipula]